MKGVSKNTYIIEYQILGLNAKLVMSTKNSNIPLPPKGVMDVWPTSFFINI